MAFDPQALGVEFIRWASRLIGLIFAMLSIYALVHWFNKRKRYIYTVRVYEKDSLGNVIEKPTDSGGIFLDKKTQYRLFLLKNNKCGLTPDNVPYLLSSTGRKVVYILQTGLKSFQYMKPAVSDNPGITFGVQDEDVAWAINAYARHKAAFQTSLLEKVLPFLGMAFVFMTVIVALYYIFDNMSVLTEVAASFRDTADTLAKIKLGTAVVGG